MYSFENLLQLALNSISNHVRVLAFEEILPEFTTKNNLQLCQTMPKSKKGDGSYSKNDKQSRQNEVLELHFEYVYSVRNISNEQSFQILGIGVAR